jgi:iron complex transport system substrate-binding protein
VPLRRLCILLLLLALLGMGPGVWAQASEPPRRIVSTSPAITETLFALGLGDRVVGVSRYCSYPAAVLTLPKVGSFLKPDAEAIARLSPDLVLVQMAGDGLEGRLSSMGLHFVAIERDESLPGIFKAMRQIGAAAFVSERADALVRDTERRLAELRARTARRPHPKVLLIVGRRPGTLSDIVAIGHDSYLDELIRIAGGRNVLSDPSLPAYPRISIETVIRLRPDVLIDTGDMGDTPAERERQGRANEALWRGSELVAAAGVKRIFAATVDPLVVPGPRVVDAAEWLTSLIQDDPVP